MVERRQLREAHDGKVLRAQPHQPPARGVHRREREFAFQEIVFSLQEAEILVLAVLRPVQEPGLPDEEGFHLQEVVAVLADGLRLDAQGPLLKGVGIRAEPEAPREGDERGAFPVAARALQVLADAQRLFFEPFHGERTQVAVRVDGGDGRDYFVAGRVFLFLQKLLIVLGDVRRHGQYKLRQRAPVGRSGLCAVCTHDVQDCVVVGRVEVVAVGKPVGGFLVDFHVARPQRAADFDFGVEEVGAGVAVVQSRVDDVYGLAVGSGERRAWPKLLLPNVMQ